MKCMYMRDAIEEAYFKVWSASHLLVNLQGRKDELPLSMANDRKSV